MAVGAIVATPGIQELRREHQASKYPWKAREFFEATQGEVDGDAGGESLEARTASEQFAQSRTAPGVVNPAGYQTALGALKGLPQSGSAWSEVTNVPYDADDPRFRDYYSNSSGGSGYVTGRITGVAADGTGHVYAAGANGGVFRATLGTEDASKTTGKWTPIADSLGSLSGGDVRLDPKGALWYATGEANTGATSYVGLGVYALTSPSSQTFDPTTSRVGGSELDATTINAVRFDKSGSTAYVATSRGLWSHSTDLKNHRSDPWKQLWAPNPKLLPGGAMGNEPNAPYANIVNDVAIDPKDAKHIVLAQGWRSGALSLSDGTSLYYGGFKESRDGGATWSSVNLGGTIPADDVGNVTMQYSAGGERLYVINQSPKLLNKPSGTVNSYLDGVYVSKSGNPSGPYSKIATSEKLASSGSALKQSVGGKGYGPGVQAWYNQQISVDPANPDHVVIGLEEVYESRDGGAGWKTIAPYWDFYFSCWGSDFKQRFAGCPQGSHSDQHSSAVGFSGGKAFLYVGNDGGLLRRPLNGGAADADGHATDWQPLADGSIDALQYYSVSVGAMNPASYAEAQKNIAYEAGTPYATLPAGTGPIVSGGLQDNGGSILVEGSGQMSSNFGGDGADSLANPADGCQIVQEYVYLSMRMTRTCAAQSSPQAFTDPTKATTYDIAPPDSNARFIAPFAADPGNINTWVAGGTKLWLQTNGFGIKSGADWMPVADLKQYSASATVTAVAVSGDRFAAAWCGPCNNAGFKRGLVVGHFTGTTAGKDVAGTIDYVLKPYSTTDADSTKIANRYIGGVTFDKDGKVLVTASGFSRRFTEGPGADTGHVWSIAGSTVTNLSAGMPDLPTNSIKALPNGGILVGTDLGVVYRTASGTWTRVGANLPYTTVMDLEVYGSTLYAATHGRGIWQTALPTS